MPLWLQVLGFGLLGYLSGSLPFAVWITRLAKGVDVRKAGSGHATATNTFRQAGLMPGTVVFALDIAKGFVPTYLGIQFGSAVWIPAITAGFAVAGHCWPILAGFRGGMGLATAGGTILACSPLGFVLCLGVLVALTLTMHHAARASVIAGLICPLVLWLFNMEAETIAVSGAVGLVIALRFLGDWRRQYRELWLDRDADTGESNKHV
jgi:glycerol-3-phosphate acyltransferase PlsY